MSLPELTLAQYQIVYNSLSFVIASFLGALLYFIMSHREVAPKYRTAVTISAVIMTIAGYHYFRIFNSWEAAYHIAGQIYKPTGEYFDASYRYIDWLLTVPLLSAELLIAACAVGARTSGRMARLMIAALLMIVFGLIGEVSNDPSQRTIWAVLSTIPFIYLIFALWKLVGQELPNLPKEIRSTASNLRYLLIATWGVYPIVYSFPNWGLTTAPWLVTSQVAFCTADALAKALFGLMLHRIAAVRSRDEGYRTV